MYCNYPKDFNGITVPCRKCPGCQDYRRYQWRYRLMVELRMAPRTWFCTWTFRPNKDRQVPELDELRDTFQRYMKRLRKKCTNSQVTFRYFTAAELGTVNSRPHLHSLMFVYGNAEAATYRALKSSWNSGFIDLRLARPGHIRYVSKYVTKGKSDIFRTMTSQSLGFHQVWESPNKPPEWYIRAAAKRGYALEIN